MKIAIDTADMLPDQFGEFFRNYFFTKGKGFGCYSNFEVEPFMIEGRLLPELVEKYFGNYGEPYRFFSHKYDSGECANVWFAYAWDGDGVLIVSDGEKVCENRDCKKTYGWKFIN